MTVSAHVTVEIDLQRIRANAQAISKLTNVPLLAVIKADAYGLGAERVSTVLADLVEGFCVFSLDEAARIDLIARTGKSALAIGPPDANGRDAYRAQHVRPAVFTPADAAALKSADPVLSVDTGMQRFACPADQIDAVLRAGDCREAYTHAIRLDQVDRLRSLVGDRGVRLHAAGSSLLHAPAARLDAVRPGIALYRGAARVSARLVDARDSTGSAGYTGFRSPRHGVIVAGYSNGLRPGPCLVNDQPQTLVEVGMQSAYVSLARDDRPGDEVILLGDGLTESAVAAAWQSSEQEALVSLAQSGVRVYRG